MESNDEFIARVEAEAAMPDKTTVALPELPTPMARLYRDKAGMRRWNNDACIGDDIPVWSAHYMRAYATAALAQKDGEIERLREALESVWLWMENQADGQSKGGHATFDLMALREQREAARAALGSQA